MTDPYGPDETISGTDEKVHVDCSGEYDKAVQVAICIKIDELCIKDDGFCIKNDEFCIKNDDFNTGCEGAAVNLS